MDVQVAPSGTTQVRNPPGPQRLNRLRLGARRDVDLLLAVQGVQLEAGAQRRRGHRYGQPAVQVVALAGEGRVGLLVHLDIEIAGWPTARADLALAGQPDAHPVLDPGRDLHRQRPPRPDAAVATALVTRMLDDRPDATTPAAGAGGHDLTQERPLYGLHLTAAAAGLAGGRVGAGGRALAAAGTADHRGLQGQLPGAAEGSFGQVEIDPKQCVGALSGPAARSAGLPRTAAEEGVHDIAEAAEPLRKGIAGRAGTALQGVAAQVDDLPLLRVRQDLVRCRHLLETLLRGGIGVDVGVQFAGQLAVGLFQGGVVSAPVDAEDAVVVGRHGSAPPLRHRRAVRRRNAPPRGPTRWLPGSPFGWARRRRVRRRRRPRGRSRP